LTKDSPKTLNKMTIYAENQIHAEQASQAGGRINLRRSVRRAPADATGKGGVHCGLSCGRDRISQTNAVRLGIYKVIAPSQIFTATCESPRRERSDAYTERIIAPNGQISENLEKFLNFSNLVFPHQNEISERILEKNTKIRIILTPVIRVGALTAYQPRLLRPVSNDIKTSERRGCFTYLLTMREHDQRRTGIISADCPTCIPYRSLASSSLRYRLEAGTGIFTYHPLRSVTTVACPVRLTPRNRQGVL
jgi:hypothetical protein